jgi:hypothetical protein
MRNRRTTLLWMKDLLEHMNRCHDQLEWAAEGPASTFLTESRLLCEQLQDVRPASMGARSFAATA